MVNGWLNLDKPTGMSSAQAVTQIKRIFGIKKAGHLGTLDPLASGILPIALGEATKTIPYLSCNLKAYNFTIKWGKQTTTDDLDGDIIRTSTIKPEYNQINCVIKDFIGEITQTPPQFSAVKIKGARAYKLARSGQKVNIKPRQVKIHELKMIFLDTINNSADFSIDLLQKVIENVREVEEEADQVRKKMSFSYYNMKKHPRNFRNITGLTIEEFKKVVEKVRSGWEKQKKCHGRRSKLPTLEDKLFCVILYYRTYITHRFLGCLFNVHNANVCRLLKRIEPLLAKKVTITKDRSMTPEKILKILADVTEQQIQRPEDSKKRKKSYSGKKRTNTMKTEIIIEEGGRILSVSKSYRGRISDFRIRKQEKYLPLDSIKHADSGYQGWQKLQSKAINSRAERA